MSGFSRTSIGNIVCRSFRVYTNRPERLRGFSYIGLHRYFLTFCTFQRCRWLDNSENVCLARAEIMRAADHERFAILAYCFMPDH